MDYRVVFKNHPKELERIEDYKRLGYSDDESIVLGCFAYGITDNLMDAVVKYNGRSEEKKKKKSFCKYLVGKMEKYINKNYEDGVIPQLDDVGILLSSFMPKDSKFLRDFGSFGSFGSFGGGFGMGMGAPVRGGLGMGLGSAPVMYKSANAPIAPQASVNMGRVDSFDIDEDENVDSWDIDFDEVDESFDASESLMYSMEESSLFLTEEVLEPELDVEDVFTDNYKGIEEKGFRNVLNSPTSTFRMTTNNASLGILKSKTNHGLMIDPSMVRIEEVLNHFRFNLAKPTRRMFNIVTEVSNKPNSNNKLLFVGVQGKKYLPEKQNIVLLLDTSGSMASMDRSVSIQKAIFTIVKKMRKGDILSLITYSDTDHTIFKNLVLTDDSVDTIIRGLFSIQITGCTYGSKGIETAYKLIEDNYIKDGINHVVLMTDGDLNFGVTSENGLTELISKKKESGAFLSVLGVGLSNYKDVTMETLAKNGNGNYSVINDEDDVYESIELKYDSLMFPIAKDVKAQVEFNPKYVKSYRLLGYENRALNHEDFKDDKVISEPFGSNGYGIALYELEMQNVESVSKLDSGLKYQNVSLKDSENICTVSVRYKEPDKETSEELHVDVRSSADKQGMLTENLKLAYSIVNICEYLRRSKLFEKESIKTIKTYINRDQLPDLYYKNGKVMGYLKALINYIVEHPDI